MYRVSLFRRAMLSPFFVPVVAIVPHDFECGMARCIATPLQFCLNCNCGKIDGL